MTEEDTTDTTTTRRQRREKTRYVVQEHTGDNNWRDLGALDVPAGTQRQGLLEAAQAQFTEIRLEIGDELPLRFLPAQYAEPVIAVLPPPEPPKLTVKKG